MYLHEFEKSFASSASLISETIILGVINLNNSAESSLASELLDETIWGNLLNSLTA